MFLKYIKKNKNNNNDKRTLNNKKTAITMQRWHSIYFITKKRIILKKLKKIKVCFKISELYMEMRALVRREHDENDP